MTYGYLLAIPCIGAPPSTQSRHLCLTIPFFVGLYAMSMAKIKYEEGYIDLRALGYGVIPKPHQLWSKANISWILPTNLVLATGWSMEIISHLEELAFWLFLLHQVRMMETPFSSFGGHQRDLITLHAGTKSTPLVLKLGIPRLGPRFSYGRRGSPDPDIPPSQQCRPTRILALLCRVDGFSRGHPLVPRRPLEIPGLLASRPV